MCKFNQNLFVTIFFLALFKTLNAYPVDYSLLDDLIDDPTYDSDRDLTYDQRQNGTENFRLRVDGVVIAVPQSASSQASSSIGNLAANYLLQLAAATEEDEDGDFSPFLKNSNNENGVTAPTADKDDKNIKKKATPGSPKDPIKDNQLKRVVYLKDAANNEQSNVVVQPSTAVDVVPQEQSKFEVIPIRKVQSRRKNKYCLLNSNIFITEEILLTKI